MKDSFFNLKLTPEIASNLFGVLYGIFRSYLSQDVGLNNLYAELEKYLIQQYGKAGFELMKMEMDAAMQEAMRIN